MRGAKVCRAKCQKYLAEWIHASILQGFFFIIIMHLSQMLMVAQIWYMEHKSAMVASHKCCVSHGTTSLQCESSKSIGLLDSKSISMASRTVYCSWKYYSDRKLMKNKNRKFLKVNILIINQVYMFDDIFHNAQWGMQISCNIHVWKIGYYHFVYLY